MLFTYISESIVNHALPISGKSPIIQWHLISEKDHLIYAYYV